MTKKRGAKKAVLLIHGILETPSFFDPLLSVIPKDWTVRAVLLEGHAGTVADFSKTSMSRWKAQVHNAVRELAAAHDKVVIAAHSMGTLFAIRESFNFPIAAMFLMNVPLKIELKPLLMKTVWGIYSGRIDPGDKRTAEAKRTYGIKRDLNVFHYISWIPKYLELFDEIAKIRPLAKDIRTPTIAYFSKNDEMLSIRSAEYFRNAPRVKLRLLKNSYHFYFDPNELLSMQRALRDLLDKFK